MWVIINKGRYVKDVHKHGGDSAYTNNLLYAQKFATEAEAIANKCGNETVSYYEH